jgi:hypothetical protein
MTTATTDWVMTASGRQFWPLSPRPCDVTIEDIAHALAAVARFGGHARVPYSVAQHSVLVSWAMCGTLQDALYGLLHDASEAYLGDVPRPLKRLPAFAAYREAEARLQAVIYDACGLDPDGEPPDLKLVDRRMLRTEQRDLMPAAACDEDRTGVPPFDEVIQPWDFHMARLLFLEQFHILNGRRAF